MVLPTLDRGTALTWVIGDCCVFVTKVVSLVSVGAETLATYQHSGTICVGKEVPSWSQTRLLEEHSR